MTKRITVAELLAQNPHLDRDEVEKGLKVLEELERMGVPKKGYSLRPPFQRGIVPAKRRAVLAQRAGGRSSW